MKYLIAGNWKMNGSTSMATSLITDIQEGISNDSTLLNHCDFLVCPTFLHISMVNNLRNDGVLLGGQDCSENDDGAYTGNISATMLRDMGCEYVILGHSERREYHAETDALIQQKAEKGHTEGLITIICVGETDEERQSGKQEEIVGKQLEASIPPSATAENTVIAYEPVWAIGTGNSATAKDVEDMHGFIRKKLQEKLEDSDKVRILYGGSVKPENAGELLGIDNVNGALIGGASLKAEQFLGIAEAVSK